MSTHIDKPFRQLDIALESCIVRRRWVLLTHSTTGIYSAPPAMPYTTPCSTIRCHTFVAKLDKAIVPTQMNKHTIIIGFVNLGYFCVKNIMPKPSIYWMPSVIVPIALMADSLAPRNGESGEERYHSWNTP